MKFNIKNIPANLESSDCIIVGVYEDAQLTPAAQQIDAASGSYITKILQDGNIQGKIGQLMLLPHVPDIKSPRVLLVGCGKLGKLNENNYQKIISAAFNGLKQSKFSHVTCYLSELLIPQRDIHWLIRDAMLRIHECYYFYDTYKSKKADPITLQDISFFAPSAQDMSLAEEAVKEGDAITAGMTLTKNLGNTPSNICTPTYLADAATKLGKQYSTLKVKVFDEKAILKMGMGALAAVSQGSKEPCKLIVFEYKGGAKDDKPIALVGKGITFDTGGISLKPAGGMDEMKYDMCGAASVFGTIKAIAELNLPINVVALVASAENMPGGSAYKPGDVITSYSGKTIEILNTDAEGRMVLCDAISYAHEFNPRAIIDVATLTGGIIVTLGSIASGLFSNDEQLAEQLTRAANQSYDRIWPLPVWEDYHKLIDTPYADMANAGSEPGAHSITAAVFLQKFIKNTPWAHLDVAGTAHVRGKNKKATARPVPLLVQYLLNESNK